MPDYPTLAAVDLGSNSFHLQVARVVGEQIYPLDSLREAVRLGAGLGDDKRLDEDSQARASAKERQREILENELTKEQSLLDQARKELEEQESVRTGDERNYARVLERLQKYKDAVDLHQKNVESLRRELANLNR